MPMLPFVKLVDIYGSMFVINANYIVKITTVASGVQLNYSDGTSNIVAKTVEEIESLISHAMQGPGC